MALFICIATPALAADTPGSMDHPMISRYTGSTITGFESVELEELELPLGPAKGRRGFGSSKKVGGHITRIAYNLDKSHSTLDVYTNYKQALTGAGFEIPYACDVDCGGLDFNIVFLKTQGQLGGLGFSSNHQDQRYLSARLQRTDGEVYVALYVVRNTVSGGPTRDEINTLLAVLETTPLASDKVRVDADAMSKALQETGRIALYGVYFETGKAELKSESGPALEQMTQLLNASPTLKLAVVGHTDNQGEIEANMTLSRQRAEAVVSSLTAKGIDASRLRAWGVGWLSPVATNRTEEGRALNRRVELVEQ